jgi:hypothetical protein
MDIWTIGVNTFVLSDEMSASIPVGVKTSRYPMVLSPPLSHLIGKQNIIHNTSQEPSLSTKKAGGLFKRIEKAFRQVNLFFDWVSTFC